MKIEELPRDQIFETLKAHAPPPRNEVVIGRIRDVGAKVLPLLGEDQLKTLLAPLADDALFSMTIADRAASVIRGAFPDAQAFDPIRDDAAIRSASTIPVSVAFGAP